MQPFQATVCLIIQLIIDSLLLLEDWWLGRTQYPWLHKDTDRIPTTPSVRTNAIWQKSFNSSQPSLATEVTSNQMLGFAEF